MTDPSRHKPSKPRPVLITSRDAMLAGVADWHAHKCEAKRIQLRLESIHARATRRLQPAIDDHHRHIQAIEAGLQMWAAAHPEEFPTRRKSIDLPLASLGFRTGPPKLVKLKARDTWLDIALRLASTATATDSGEIGFIGENYVRYSDPAVDKDAIIRDRQDIPPAALKSVGVAITQDEFFFIEPSSDVLDDVSTKVSAAA